MNELHDHERDAVVVIAAMWWLHPKPGAEYAGKATEVTIWFNGVVEARHIDVVDETRWLERIDTSIG